MRLDFRSLNFVSLRVRCRCPALQSSLAQIQVRFCKARLQKCRCNPSVVPETVGRGTILADFEWSDLKVILALSQGGSVAAAARLLGVDSSTVSRRLAAAEEALGAVLVLRGGRDFRFTTEGTMAVRTAEAMEAAISSTSKAIKSAKQAIEGKVKITSVGAFFHVIQPFCEVIAKKYPKLVIEIDDSDAVLNLSSGEADVAVRFFMPKEPDLIARRAFDQNWYIYASKGYVDHYGLPQTHDDLRAHRLILYIESRLRLPAFAWMEQFKSGQERYVRVTSPGVALSAVAAGSGIAGLPAWLDPGHFGLVRVFPEPYHSQPAYVVYHESLRDSARIRTVVDELIAFLSDQKILNTSCGASGP
jgi:DNA-binding transcriptional LysR family regulator